MAAQHAGGAYATRYKFNGKELDPQTGYYYYGARYYDPVVSRWLSVDPLAEKFTGLTPYNYTLNNPIILADRDGRDTVWIDQKKGYWLHYVKAKGNDVFIILNDDNKEVNRLELPENSLERLDTWAGEYGDERTGETSNGIDIYRIRGDKNAKKLFEFLANNTKVEWGWWQTGAPKIGELNFLTTTHLAYRSYNTLFNKQLVYGYNLRLHVHSHPLHPNPSPEDFTGKNKILNYLKLIYPVYFGYLPRLKFAIYSPRPVYDIKNNTYTRYLFYQNVNTKEELKDFYSY